MENLTISNAIVLASIIEAAQGNKTVKWVDNDTVFSGTARSISQHNGCFFSRTDDVRNAFLRITMDAGTELFMPISQAMELVTDSAMFFNAH